jgi:hypothetical protein
MPIFNQGEPDSHDVWLATTIADHVLGHREGSPLHPPGDQRHDVEAEVNLRDTIYALKTTACLGGALVFILLATLAVILTAGWIIYFGLKAFGVEI